MCSLVVLIVAFFFCVASAAHYYLVDKPRIARQVIHPYILLPTDILQAQEQLERLAERHRRYVKETEVQAVRDWEDCMKRVDITGDAYTVKVSDDLQRRVSLNHDDSLLHLMINYHPYREPTEEQKQEVLSLDTRIRWGSIHRSPLYIFSIENCPPSVLVLLAVLPWVGFIRESQRVYAAGKQTRS